MKRSDNFIVFLVFISFCFFLSACTEKSELQISGRTMGTQYHLTIVPQKNEKDLTLIIKNDVALLLKNLNQQMSTYLNDSEISQFNQFQNKSWFPVSTDFAFVVESALKVSQETQGAFDITVAPLVNLWGFGSQSILKIPLENEIESVMNSIGYQQLEVNTNPPALRKLNIKLQIDLSAIAKGYAVDKVATYLDLKGYDNYLVEIGGEIRLKGKNSSRKLWKVGIKTPEKEKNNLEEPLLLSNTALATSGDYRNYFIQNGQRYSHTINPQTGRPITHQLASVTVLYGSTMLADAYATAFMVMGSEKSKVFTKKYNIRVKMIIRENDDSFVTWQNID